MVPKHSDEVMSSVFRHNKAVIRIMKRMCALYKFRLVRSYTAIGYAFNVNESIMYIGYNVFKQKNMQNMLIGL